MSKQIKYWDELRSKMFSWIETVAKTVTLTMWPKWRNVILDKWFWVPQVTNDGVTIAKEIELEDGFESLWAELVKEAASKTNELAWDGTSTATLLTYALAKEWLREIRSGINAVELKNGMKKAGEAVIKELEKNSKQISTGEEIAQVATLSAQDNEVWDIIAQAMEKVGNNWVISVEEWQTFWLELEVTEGMEFDQGYISPYMINNSEKMLAQFKDAPILITDHKISSMKDILPLLEQLLGEGKKDLVIIWEDIEWEALTTIILNKLKGVLNILWIKSPWFWDRKKDLLKDIAILTGANIITGELGMKLESATLGDLWTAKNIISQKWKTIIIGGGWEKEAIQNRIEELKNIISHSSSTYDKEKLIERLAKLDGWVAVIKVWAASEVEMKEKKLRIEDALNATRAAVAEWVVAWGWVALFKAAKILEAKDFENRDQNIWAQIVKNALSYPLKQIVENAGKDPGAILAKVWESTEQNFWYDAAKDEYIDMLKSGIIDPTKVERIALEQSISLAWMFITTESWVIPNKSQEPHDHGMPGWMWGMWGMGMY